MTKASDFPVADQQFDNGTQQWYACPTYGPLNQPSGTLLIDLTGTSGGIGCHEQTDSQHAFVTTPDTMRSDPIRQRITPASPTTATATAWAARRARPR